MDTELAIVVVSYNAARTIEACLDSLARHAPGMPVVVVDNASDDGTAALVAARGPAVRLIEAGDNLGFGQACNLGMSAVPARFHYLHNADAYLQAPVLGQALAMLRDAPEIGVMGLPLVYPDQRPQTAAYGFSGPAKWAMQAVGLGHLGRLIAHGPLRRVALRWLGGFAVAGPFLRQFRTGAREGGSADVDWICGAAMILRDETRVALGGFDPAFFLYAEDEDLCLRAARAGWRVVQADVVPVIHDFGWGRASARVVALRVAALRVFIDKHFAARRLARTAMHGLLWLKSLGWRLG